MRSMAKGYKGTLQATVVVLCGLVLAHPASAQQNSCVERSLFPEGSTLNVRIENDLFGGVGQDQGYTNGFLFTSVSSNLVSFRDNPCLPQPVVLLNRFLTWMQPEGFDEQNLTLGLGQVIYTPIDNKRTDLITDDRPYAAALLFSTGYNVRRGESLQTSQIRFGMVGPAAYGGEVQNAWHDLIGVERFYGWDNQLHNEFVVQLIHERRKRLLGLDRSGPWGGDMIAHWGGSFGNFATYANAGAEWRWGYGVPNDFGSAPLGPAGENTSPMPAETARRSTGLSGHYFLALDTRWVLHDITLDGNTFKDSHSVDKRPFVADVSTGLSVAYGAWKLAMARHFRTREFEGQRDRPIYGSFTVSRRF